MVFHLSIKHLKGVNINAGYKYKGNILSVKTF